MNFKIVREDGKEIEHKINNVPEALMLAIPAMTVAISRGVGNTMTCNDEFGNVFRIQTPARKPCAHDGIEIIEEKAQ
jgi:hypothetical protein